MKNQGRLSLIIIHVWCYAVEHRSICPDFNRSYHINPIFWDMQLLWFFLLLSLSCILYLFWLFAFQQPLNIQQGILGKSLDNVHQSIKSSVHILEASKILGVSKLLGVIKYSLELSRIMRKLISWHVASRNCLACISVQSDHCLHCVYKAP